MASGHYHLSKKEVKETIIKMREKIASLLKNLIVLHEEGSILEQQIGAIVQIEKSFEPSDIHRIIQLNETQRARNVASLIEMINNLKNPSFSTELQSRLQSFYHNATQRTNSTDQECLSEKELLGLPNRKMIIENAQNYMASYYGEVKDMHSSDILILTEQIEYSLAETNTLLAKVSTHLRSSLSSSDQAYLLEHQDTLLIDKLFYEYARYYNKQLLNQHKEKTQRRLDKTIRFCFAAYSLGSGVHAQLKADGQKWDHYLQNAKENPAITFSASDFYSSESSQEFITRLLERKISTASFSPLTQKLRDIEASSASTISQAQQQDIIPIRSQKTTKSTAVVAMPQQGMVVQNITLTYGQNFQETYSEYFVKQVRSGNQPLSQAEHNRNKMAYIGLVSREIDSLTITDAGQAILCGMSDQMKTETIDFAKRMAIGVAVRYAATCTAGIIAPEILAVGYGGLALFSLYQNGEAAIHSGKELVHAINQKQYDRIGHDLVGFTLSITSLGGNAKNTVIHFKNAPQLYAALAQRFTPKHLEIAGMPGAHFAAPKKAQSSSRSNSTQPRNANKSGAAHAAEAAREQKIKAHFGNNVPAYIKERRVPTDSETILATNGFVRTKYKGIESVQKALIYKKDGLYYYRDKFHVGLAAELEVFDSNGKHLGTADVITGILKPNTAVPGRKIDN